MSGASSFRRPVGLTARDAAWRIWISGLTVREWLWLNDNGG